MTPSLARHPIAIALAAAAIVLAAVIAFEAGFVGPAATVRPAPRAAAPVDTKLVPPVVATAAEQAYPETAARPLFTPTRRPAPVAPAGAQTMAKGQFVLQGVIMAGGTNVAFLKEKSGNRTHRVEQGKTVNGITVSEIDREKVVLTQGGDQEVLNLLVQKPGAPAAPAAAPAAQAAAAPAGPFAAQPSTPVAAAPAAAPGTAAPPGGPVSAPQFRAPGTATNPATRAPVPGVATPAPGAPATPAAETMQPLTPEELLARRRARRALQNQNPQ